MNQATMFDVETAPMAQSVPAVRPEQSSMLIALADPVADVAGHLPADLRAVLAGYALAGLDQPRQTNILADLGTGRITTKGALERRCKEALKAQTQEAQHPFAWGS